MGFKLDTGILDRNLGNMTNKFNAMVLMYSVESAKKLQDYMQQKRPWTDRTGEAKRRLRAVVSQPDDHTVRITLAHGVEYGIWLELAHEKRFAIIQPTINTQGPRVLEGFNGMINKIKF